VVLASGFVAPVIAVSFHTNARLWAERAIFAGNLTIPDLQKGAGEPCTLLSGRRTGVPLPEDTEPADPALLAVLGKVGRIELRVAIGAEGIARLVYLGWLDRNQCQQPAMLAEVLIDLANGALDAGLRPR
jgi:hypothetical protein